jgi:hypothetical protein
MPKPENATSFCPAIAGVGAVPIDVEGNLVLDGFNSEQKKEIKRQYAATFSLPTEQEDEKKAESPAK